MNKWRYDITSHSLDQVRAVRQKLGLSVDEEKHVLFCTDKGACFFDNIPNPNIQAIIEILDRKGAEGWELVSVNFRTDEMVCFWKRSTE